MLPMRRGNIAYLLRSLGMKTINLLNLTTAALIGLASTAWAGPHGGGGGFGGGQFGGSHFGGAHFGGYSGSIRAGPTFSAGGARFSGNRSMAALSHAPQRFYYTGARRSAAVPRASVTQVPNRSISSTAGRVAPVSRQQNRVNSAVGQKRVTKSPISTAANRQSFVRNHAFARHDGSWHRDWDKHHAHFDHGHVFVFVGGFWWGLFPWDYYPYYGDYPYDNSYDYSGDPYDGADYSPSQSYSYYNGYVPSGQYANTVVSAVQSKLVSLGYYHGAIDGILGDESEAALAQYQQDQDLSVTGTVTTDTLRALGLPYSGF